ncbi:MAG: arsenate reductase (glutaredoxin) [Verrucomicrobia bacterium]|nr:arsenate reductase (glutaredoxin) [Verrucomicrobiota bacterium]
MIRIYHNPRCSKSRQTLAMLEEKGVDVEIIEYLNHPPSTAVLDMICRQLNMDPLELIRTKEARFKELGLSVQDQRPRREWLKLMVENPVLIERPIVLAGNKAVLGRPPENALALL